MDGCFCHAFTDQNRLVQLYGLSDLGVWPRQESTSMLDCLSCGVPIIVNDTVELTERIDGNGLYFRMDDFQHLADQIERLVLDPALRKEFAVVGREKILAEFSWSKYASEYLKLIESPVL